MKTENKNYLLGKELSLKGLRYTMIPDAVGGSVHADIYKGFDDEQRRSRCGFLDRTWNRNNGYQPSYDLRCWFN